MLPKNFYSLSRPDMDHFVAEMKILDIVIVREKLQEVYLRFDDEIMASLHPA